MSSSTSRITPVIGTSQAIAIVPAARSVYIAASGPYATDDKASDEKTGSAFHFGSRSARSASDVSGRPNTTPRARASARPSGVSDSSAASFALRTPGAS
jgi:hypothetical protein